VLDDEIRDLFIRLQSGTALGRQQIRDAWPGKAGPFVVGLAGKMDRQPSARLFGIVDLRGHRPDDEGETDDYVSDRQTCAQLLKVFLAREQNPWAFPSVAAADLDAMYHDQTDFDDKGDIAKRFKVALEYAEKVLEKAIALNRGSGVTKRKFKKLEVFATVALFHDLGRTPSFKLTPAGLTELARQLVDSPRDGEPGGRITRGTGIAAYYNWWREHVVKTLPGVELDPVRLFPDNMKEAISLRDNGQCAICRSDVEAEEAEYDHYPVPYRDGGRTEVANGRLVHKDCHPRGRPPSED
jgi:hypothetical protein